MNSNKTIKHEWAQKQQTQANGIKTETESSLIKVLCTLFVRVRAYHRCRRRRRRRLAHLLCELVIHTFVFLLLAVAGAHSMRLVGKAIQCVCNPINRQCPRSKASRRASTRGSSPLYYYNSVQRCGPAAVKKTVRTSENPAKTNGRVFAPKKADAKQKAPKSLSSKLILLHGLFYIRCCNSVHSAWTSTHPCHANAICDLSSCLSFIRECVAWD